MDRLDLSVFDGKAELSLANQKSVCAEQFPAPAFERGQVVIFAAGYLFQFVCGCNQFMRHAMTPGR